MRYSRRYREIEDEEAQIDISPLIDIVFILVIFFIVTTVFNKEVGVEIDKPPRVSSSKDLARDSVMIAITESGQVFHGGKNIGFDGIEPTIDTVRQGGEPVPVILLCDRTANAEAITRAVNAATVADAKSISLVTQK